MKKLLMILFCITPLTVQAVDKTACEAMKGTAYTIGTHTYCQSSMFLSWWSARSWCMALGTDLVDLSTTCSDYYRTGSCPELKGITTRSWTRNVPSAYKAFTVENNGGVWEYCRQGETCPGDGSYWFRALCE